jgi:chemotaxis signal transduction protein
MLLAVAGVRGRAGLIVDRVVGSASVDETTIVPLPRLFDGIERDWFEGLARIDSRVVALVRTDGVVAPRDSLMAGACGAPLPCDREG